MEHLYSLEVHCQFVQRERMAEAAAERLLAELPQASASRRTFGQIAHRAVSQLMAGLLLFAGLLLTSSSAFAEPVIDQVNLPAPGDQPTFLGEAAEKIQTFTPQRSGRLLGVWVAAVCDQRCGLTTIRVVDRSTAVETTVSAANWSGANGGTLQFVSLSPAPRVSAGDTVMIQFCFLGLQDQGCLDNFALRTTPHKYARGQLWQDGTQLGVDLVFQTLMSDETPPAVTLTATPNSETTDTTARFVFNAIDPDDSSSFSFSCGLDGAPFAPCGSSVTSGSMSFDNLSVAQHSFAVHAADTSGNTGLDASYSWRVLPAQPRIGALSFNGTTGYSDVANTADLNITGSWTVEAWFKDEDPAGFNHDFRQILNKGDRLASPESPYYVLVGHNHLLAGVRSNGVDHPIDADIAYLGLDPSKWHHVAVTYRADLQVLNLWLDGTHISYLAGIPASIGNNLPVQIGRNGPTSGKYWMGKIDDVRIWNVARTGSDISAGFMKELTGTPPSGLVANWQFNQTASDFANGHTATLHDGATFVADVHP